MSEMQSAIGHGNGTGPGACELTGPSPVAEGDSTGVVGKRRTKPRRCAGCGEHWGHLMGPCVGGEPHRLAPAELAAPARPDMPRAIGYGRVSTREQAENGGSLLHQRHQVRATCELRGWEFAEWMEDRGASGKSLHRRPRLLEALRMLKAGDADVLVAAKLDRLSRSVFDFAGMLELSRKQGWDLVVLDVGADTSSPAGEMMVNVIAAFAQYERRLISQRTKDGLQARREAGVVLGAPPVVPMAVVTRVREWRAEGLTLQAIADRLNAECVPTGHGASAWRTSTVDFALRRKG